MTDKPEAAVLLSAGLDSAVLLAFETRRSRVHPVYISVGLAWEADERACLAALLSTPPFARGVAPVTELAFTMRDVYPATHWAIRGEPPAFDTPDEEVYLVGRNIVLLSKAALFAAQRKLPRIVLGVLAGNPFPDATPAFFESMAGALSLGLDHPLQIDAPFRTARKSDVIRLGRELGVALELTLSCMNPTARRHCGRCSKCRERRDAFVEAGIEDPTEYVNAPPR